MPIRTFQGIQTVASASQPVFGTTLTAAVTFSVDRYTGTNRPGTTTAPVAVPVTSSVGMKVGDRVAVGPKANFTTANRGLLDQGTIASIVSPTSITVTGLMQNHVSGEYIVLCETSDHVQIVPVTLSGAIYLGTDSTINASDSSMFAGGPPQYWQDSNPTTGTGQAYQTDQYWLFGSTPGDTFIARFDQI